MIAGRRLGASYRQKFGRIVGSILGILTSFIIIIYGLGWISYPYVNCFQAQLPPGTGTEHFERCVLGVKAVDESLQPIPWSGDSGVISTLEGFAWPYF
jgi:hypothetical protein